MSVVSRRTTVLHKAVEAIRDAVEDIKSKKPKRVASKRRGKGSQKSKGVRPPSQASSTGSPQGRTSRGSGKSRDETEKLFEDSMLQMQGCAAAAVAVSPSSLSGGSPWSPAAGDAS